MFGEVCGGEKVVLDLEKFGDKDGNPTKEVKIIACGVINPRCLDSSSETSENLDETVTK